MVTRDESRIWAAIIEAVRNGGATIDDIADDADTNTYATIRRVVAMRDLGWVEGPTDDGLVVPGDVADEFLRPLDETTPNLEK